MSKEMITIYRCDQCKLVLSNPEEKVAHGHLSIVIGSHSGWWEPTDGVESIWENTRSIKSGVYHFCDSICISKWLTKEGVL